MGEEGILAAKRKSAPRRRVSQLFKLGRSQPTLDFVDVVPTGDTPVFISPRALELFPSDWSDQCVYLLQSFFSTVLGLIKEEKHDEAEALLGVLREPNETHLGLSKGKSRGRGLGSESARGVWAALTRSAAAKSGLLRDLEDTALMIPGVGVDIVSDITTNIIRAPLITYTQEMCARYGIPLTEGVASGPMWDGHTKQWITAFVALPMAAGEKLLLVPKAIVRRELQYDTGEYYRHYLLTHLQQVELSANSSLVQVLKNGKRRVTKTSLQEKVGSGKLDIVRESLKYPEVLDRYRKEIGRREYLPLSHEDIAAAEGTPAPDWDALLAAVRDLPTGAEHANAYENAVEGLLSALFYPDLVSPVVQHQIHDGRKRIDITYMNAASGGFFKWLAAHHPSGRLFVECKNYGNEVANPELDQLAGRFSPSRGQVGLLVCRKFKNKALFLKRCHDTANDHRGFIVALDDDDLAELVRVRQTDPLYQQWKLLTVRFHSLLD